MFPSPHPMILSQVLVQAQPEKCRGILMPWWAFLQWAAGTAIFFAGFHGWPMDGHLPKDGKIW